MMRIREQHLYGGWRGALGLSRLEKTTAISKMLLAAEKGSRGRFVAASQRLKPKDIK